MVILSRPQSCCSYRPETGVEIEVALAFILRKVCHGGSAARRLPQPLTSSAESTNDSVPTLKADRLRGLAVAVPGCKPKRYHILCIALGLERGPLSLESINEKLLERKISSSGLENRD
jgi:hypothetical protein